MLETTIKISPRLSVGPQPSEEDLEKLAKKGFKTVINLSKKGELGQCFSPEEEQSIVEKLGMSYVHIPTSLSSLKDTHIAEFCQELEDASRPVYVHCRQGQRSGPLSLIFHALRKKLTAKDVISKGKKLGFEWNAPILSSVIERYLKKHTKEATA